MDAKIDAYIKENPKYWSYVQAMPRERLERSVVLNEVRELDRQQRMREGLMKRINANPALKNAYDTLVKDLPEDQKEGSLPRSRGPPAAPWPAPRDNSNKGRKVLASESALRLPRSQPTRKPVLTAGFRVLFRQIRL